MPAPYQAGSRYRCGRRSCPARLIVSLPEPRPEQVGVVPEPRRRANRRPRSANDAYPVRCQCRSSDLARPLTVAANLGRAAVRASDSRRWSRAGRSVSLTTRGRVQRIDRVAAVTSAEHDHRVVPEPAVERITAGAAVQRVRMPLPPVEHVVAAALPRSVLASGCCPWPSIASRRRSGSGRSRALLAERVA